MLRRFILSSSSTAAAVAANSCVFRGCVLCTCNAAPAAAPSTSNAVRSMSSVQELMTTAEEYDQVAIAESFLHQRKKHPDVSESRRFLRSLLMELEGCAPSPVTGKMPNTYFLTTRHWDDLQKWTKLTEDDKKVPVSWEEFCVVTGTNAENRLFQRTRRLFWLKPLDREFLSDLIFDVDKSVEEKFADRM